MKKLLAVLVQSVLFLFLDVCGGIFYHPFHVTTVLSGDPLASRTFLWDGIILMLIAWTVVLAIAALLKRLQSWLPLSTVALVIAALVGYVLKLGFVTQNW